MTKAEKLQIIAENEQKVYEAGKQAAYAEGDQGVYEAGKKAQYDEFWDSFQDKGIRSSGNYMFANGGWNDITFKPKYSLRELTNCANMFNTCKITDLKGILESRGLTFDFKNCGNMQNLIAYSTITRCPKVDGSKASGFNQFAMNAEKLVSIDEIVLKNDGSQTFISAFSNCEALEEIRFSGKIGKSIDFQWSTKLSKASIESIMAALSRDANLSTHSITLSLDAVNKAYESSEGANDGTGGHMGCFWDTAVMHNEKWTVSLI